MLQPDMIGKLNRENGTTFIISSHILDELSKIATKYGIINNGNLIEECLATDLNSRCESRIELVVEDGKIHIFEQFDRTGDISLALAAEGITVFEIVRKLESVENYYLRLVGKESE